MRKASRSRPVNARLAVPGPQLLESAVLSECERRRLLESFLRTVPRKREFWVFGYGSLMWDPGFAHDECCDARIFGYHRAFCIYSHRYRGTPERPGLVLGLDRGGSCWGKAYRVAPCQVEETIAYLWEREMVTGVYEARNVTVRAKSGRDIGGHAFVVDRKHQQYTGGLCVKTTAELITQGHGRRGACRDYLANTVAHLDELGICDGPLHKLLEEVDAQCRQRNPLADIRH